MLSLTFPHGGLGHVLCLGAHCDDIEIGCGGTLAELGKRFPRARFQWLVLSADDVREAETRDAAARIHGGAAHEVEVARFRGSYFPSCGPELKDHFEALKARVNPDLILTHRLEDRHQDHRCVAELTWNTFRSHTILEYEIPKYEGDLGAAQPLRAALARRGGREGRDADEVLSQPAPAELVQRGPVPGSPAPARGRMQRALGLRRGALRAQARAVTE